jgi:hydroxymethylglutaryl-CoA reductase
LRVADGYIFRVCYESIGDSSATTAKIDRMSEHSKKSSRLAGFYQRPLAERADVIAAWAGLDAQDRAALEHGLRLTQADQMIENVIGTYALPLGIATNFLINGRDYLIPMVIEEPSVVAACSFAAKLARTGGGFTTSSDEPIMIGQLQVLDVDNVYAAAGRVWEIRDELLREANDPTSSIVQRGGGARDLELRPFPDSPVGAMLVIHLLYDTRDAMGANAINTACERIAPRIAEVTGGRVNLRILSNLTDRRKARAECMIPAAELATKDLSGEQVVNAIVEAGAFAEIDPYRATTHNKGVMNGMDAVCIATGNDWRALESGAHAYAARNGQYTSMTHWTRDESGNLHGAIETPLAVGTVGGATRVHPTAKIAMKILNVASARELSEVIAAVGLAQNLAAIRALATEGIQRGHMSMHARQLALAAGASGDLVMRIVDTMIAEGNIRLERAKQLVSELS